MRYAWVKPVGPTETGMETDKARVVAWSTGWIGRLAIQAIDRRPDLELVGVWVHSPEKVGRDAGELAGIDAIGVAVTNDVRALLDLQPDCVVYAAHGPERDAAAVPVYVEILEAGVNVVMVSTPALVYPSGYNPTFTAQLEAAGEDSAVEGATRARLEICACRSSVCEHGRRASCRAEPLS